MALTTAQMQALKAEIIADPVLNAAPNNSDGSFFIAAELNKLASPAFIVWRTDIPTKDIKKAIVWTEYIGRSQGERDAFVLINSNGIVNAADANVRQGFNDIFSGPSGVATRTNLSAMAKRSATRAEKVLATGTGTDATPATMGFEGRLSFQDVDQVRAS
jgi:hypothetical protein